MSWLKKALDWMYEEPRVGGQYVDYVPPTEISSETEETVSNRESVLIEKTELLEAEAKVVEGRDISEPVFAIGKATEDKLNRWKFYSEDNKYLLITDKVTGRDYYISRKGSTWRTFDYWDISFIERCFSEGISCSSVVEILTDGSFVLFSYNNVFNVKELEYLSECFTRLVNRKLEQARRVYDYRIYKGELNKIEGKRKSIRAGLETREKLLQEYCSE